MGPRGLTKRLQARCDSDKFELAVASARHARSPHDLCFPAHLDGAGPGLDRYWHLGWPRPTREGPENSHLKNVQKKEPNLNKGSKQQGRIAQPNLRYKLHIGGLVSPTPWGLEPSSGDTLQLIPFYQPQQGRSWGRVWAPAAGPSVERDKRP